MSTPITIIQRARFVLTPNNPDCSTYDASPQKIQQPAIIDIGGFKLYSDTPTTAGQAAKINERVSELSEAK